MTPDAMRALFERVCAEHKITWQYTADDWRASQQRRHVKVPPPFDDESLAIALHEAGHVVVGNCPGGPLHFDRRRDTSACLSCERAAWLKAREWVTFTPRMLARMRQAFGTYRTIPAPFESQRLADVMLGRVDALIELQKRRKFEELEERLALARRSI